MSTLKQRANQKLDQARIYQAEWLEARYEDYVKPKIMERVTAILEVEPDQIENLRLRHAPDVHTSEWNFECDGLNFLIKFKFFGRVGNKPEELKVGERYLYLIHRYTYHRILGGMVDEDRIVRATKYGGYIENLVDLGAALELL